MLARRVCRDACRNAAQEDAQDAAGCATNTTTNTAAAASTPSPSVAAVLSGTAKGGVNFRQRLHAEANSIFLCVEHQVLSDTHWRAFLDRAAAHAKRRGERAQFVAALARAHAQLGVQLETSRRKAHNSGRSRTGRDRRKRLETQMQRVGAWLAAEVGTPREAARDTDTASAAAPAADESTFGFAPFFPLLGIWDG